MDKAHMKMTAKTYLGQMRKAESKSSPKCGELRECGEGMSSRYLQKMTKKVHA